MPPGSNAFFCRDRRVVREDLIGALVRFGPVTFTIMVTKDYEANTGPHQPVKGLPQGDVFISPYMGRYPLVLIACLNDSKPGGSVRLEEIVIQPQEGVRDRPERIKGAGNVGKALGLALRAEGTLTRDAAGQFHLTMR